MTHYQLHIIRPSHNQELKTLHMYPLRQIMQLQQLSMV